jgi:hypothetical protein
MTHSVGIYMISSGQIVHGGGWIRRQYTGRPKARFFTSLSVVWLVVSLMAVIPFFLDDGTPSFSGWKLLGFLLIGVHLVFIALAVFFALSESRRSVAELVRNPDHDPRNLY